MEISVRRVVGQCQVDKPGVIAIPHDKLRDIVRNSDADTITLELADSTLSVRTPDSHYKIYTQDAKDYPPLTFAGEAAFTVAGAVLAKLLAQSTFCVAKESTRYAFNGVLLVLDKKKLSAVGTDGRRLAHVHAAVDADGAFKHIIPAKALAVLAKTIDPEESIKISRLTRAIMALSFPPRGAVMRGERDALE